MYVHGEYDEHGMRIYVGSECVAEYHSDEPEDVEENRSLCLQEGQETAEEKGLPWSGCHYVGMPDGEFMV